MKEILGLILVLITLFFDFIFAVSSLMYMSIIFPVILSIYSIKKFINSKRISILIFLILFHISWFINAFVAPSPIIKIINIETELWTQGFVDTAILGFANLVTIGLLIYSLIAAGPDKKKNVEEKVEEQPITKTKNCIHCGTMNNEDAKFCEKCGFKFVDK